ncbi:uncharacterized protein CMC5_079330 [Chondromyces crocatus]|uniref:Uncharacterized protein n=1 Tax=Chondromyces crocatus TaxID=52 RepID=A0A0K1ESV9_CHOCO|nr:uncharacterized protein CMC5_079330 [Chondromyces crocatus]
MGREAELADLRARFAAGDRQITLLGPPGAGKTRLAERFAASEERVVRCALAGARAPDDLLRALAGALDVPLGAEERGVTRLGRALDALGAALVVLDGLEDLSKASIATVDALLDAAPDARWLCTSRHRLGLEGESCALVGGLPPPDAQALFLARARLAGRTRALDPGEVPLLETLLQRLDHLPLAVELVAARAGTLSLRQLLDAFDRRVDLLAGPATASGARPQNLRRAIEASWEQLSVDQRRTLRWAAVFEGPFSLGAAAAVLGPSEEAALQALDALRERSLVRAEEAETGGGEIHFSLYAVIRAHAAEKLEESGEREDAELAHAHHYVTEGTRLATALTGRRPREARDALARILEQVLSAHRRMRAIQPVLAVEAALAAEALLASRGPEETWRSTLDGALDLATALDEPRLLSRVLFARTRAFGMRGLYAEARRDAEGARIAAQRAGDAGAEARAVYGVSFTLRESGEDPRRALSLAEEGLALARRAGDTEAEAWCLGSVAAAAAACHEGDLALVRHEEALVLLRRLGHVRALSIGHGNLALALEAQGRFEEARAHHLEALELAEQCGDETLHGKILGALARQEHAAGRLAEAEAHLALLETSVRRTGDREGMALTQIERARWAFLGGDREAGLRALTRAHAITLTLDAPRLHREVEEARALGHAGLSPLRVHPGGDWFERAGVGRVDLSRRRSLRLLLAALIDAHPRGHALSAEVLLQAGWPGESVHPEAGAQRVWTAIRTLRKLGLASVLVQRDGGYALDPAIRLTLG